MGALAIQAKKFLVVMLYRRVLSSLAVSGGDRINEQEDAEGTPEEAGADPGRDTCDALELVSELVASRITAFIRG